LQRLDSDPTWLRRRAYRAFALGRSDIAAKDLVDFIGTRPDSDDGAYSAFLAAIAYRRLGRTSDADAVLGRVAGSVDPKTWTANVLAFLEGKLTAEAFLSRASQNGERTEAHTYIAFDDLQAGRREQALVHLRWVKEKGSRNY
jgi:tetratricopeptide (TPR) repeat protein